jgi:DNA ligase-associated metallophosphoesterase
LLNAPKKDLTAMQPITITLHGETLHLLPERAAYWPRTETLFVADVHLGKVPSFQADTLSSSALHVQNDLQRLSLAAKRTQAQKLIILGDLLHTDVSRHRHLIDTVSQWRDKHPDLKIILIRGNHDRHAGDPPSEWNITPVDGPTLGPVFILQHEPEVPSQPGAYALAGHLHPAVRLYGAGKQSMKLPCFWFREQIGVLPAFSGFTRGRTFHPMAADRVFVATHREVIEVTPT